MFTPAAKRCWLTLLSIAFANASLTITGPRPVFHPESDMTKPDLEPPLTAAPHFCNQAPPADIELPGVEVHLRAHRRGPAETPPNPNSNRQLRKAGRLLRKGGEFIKYQHPNEL